MLRTMIVALLLLCSTQLQAQTTTTAPSLRYTENADGTVTLSKAELENTLNQGATKLEEATALQQRSNAALDAATEQVLGATAMLEARTEKDRQKISEDQAIAENLQRTESALAQSEQEKAQTERALVSTQQSLGRMNGTVNYLSSEMERRRRIGWVPAPFSIIVEAVSARRHGQPFWQ